MVLLRLFKAAGNIKLVIGNAVADVYDTVLEVSNIAGKTGAKTVKNEGKDLSVLDRFIDLISGIFFTRFECADGDWYD